MTSVGRCQYLTNPGTWPYVMRCQHDATVAIRTVNDDVVSLCDEHAALITKEKG